MLHLEKLLICPICHADLPLQDWQQTSGVTCANCRRYFSFRQGVLDLTPTPPLDADVWQVWPVWEALQRNGLIAYEQDPAHNLSVGERADANAFARFCALSGVVLDIGCGPQRTLPAYVTVPTQNFVGFDPLPGIQPREFSFIKGIAEYLPFRSASFDHVLFATSLDHMLSPKRALSETKRVIKPDGKINIWFFDAAKRAQGIDLWKAKTKFALSLLHERKVAEFLRRLVGQTLAGPPVQPLTSPSTEPSYLADLTIPQGAIDAFHFLHPTQVDVEQWLSEVGLQVIRRQSFQVNHVFLQAQPVGIR